MLDHSSWFIASTYLYIKLRNIFAGNLHFKTIKIKQSFADIVVLVLISLIVYNICTVTSGFKDAISQEENLDSKWSRMQLIV